MTTLVPLKIIPGAEPFWLPASGDVGCLLIHGFTGAPAELRGLGDQLQQAGISALGVRLPGHGTSLADLVLHGRRSWISCARAGLDELLQHCRSVVICGISMGGTIALNISAGLADARVRGLVVMGAPVRLVDLHYPPAELLLMLNRWRDWGSPDIKDRTKWASHIGYRLAPVPTTIQLIRLVHETWELLPDVRLPLLAMHSRHDHTVMPINLNWLLNRVGSTEREILWLDESYHVITEDFDADRVAQQVISFTNRMARSQ
jgi:carboxylesterase